MRSALVLATLSLGLTSAAFARVDPVTIKRTPAVGQTSTVVTEGTLTIQGMDITLTSKDVEKVTAVNGDGTYTTETTQSDVTFNGMPGPTQSSATTVTQKLSGELVTVKSPPEAGNVARLQALTQVYYPANPISVGDTWTYEAKADEKLGTQAIKATFKLLGDEKIAAYDCWKVDEDVAETDATTPGKMHTTMWLDKTDGREVKVVSTFTSLPVGPDASIDGKLTMTRKD